MSKLSQKAQKHFARIKTNPADGDFNFIEWVSYAGNQRVVKKVELPDDFDVPMIYLKDKWIQLKELCEVQP